MINAYAIILIIVSFVRFIGYFYFSMDTYCDMVGECSIALITQREKEYVLLFPRDKVTWFEMDYNMFSMFPHPD